ncbi:Methyltransferase-like protein 6 [Takifugu flavidus]|uniref:Methyltransferase-like protein 6 n=1 Tax=Takifugu flavidus TaxID=433684 RepID=A0A5C6PJ17_9TELE|nr:Methyltransferase-like protein 6 [Takifugu flavidus]
MELGYVNSAVDESREKREKSGPKDFWMVGISFGLLCVLQAVLNISLRLHIDFLAELFEEVGLQPVTNDYVLRETVNKKEGLCVPRVFLQSKFTKPSQSQTLRGFEASIMKDTED